MIDEKEVENVLHRLSLYGYVAVGGCECSEITAMVIESRGLAESHRMLTGPLELADGRVEYRTTKVLRRRFRR